MPTYQYACTECDHTFEQFQSFSDDALTECPDCGGRLRKLFNAVGVVFKGSGFYRTDSRSGSSSTLPASEGGSSSNGEKSSSEKSSDKPAAKTEKAPAAAAKD
ncbi:MAG TPA: FmdB family zinc ribbon protein [Nocardioides sp.]|nr:FmdB family zinc ribbon protein [Nocardioides sp.]